MAQDFEEQPAEVSYLYGPGWSDIRKVLTKVWKSIDDSQMKLIQKTSTYPSGEGVLLTILFTTGKYFFWLANAVTLVLASVAFCLFMIVPHVVFFLIGEFAGLVFTYGIRLIEMVWIRTHKLSLVCDTCHSRYTLPVYVCPKCHKKHTRLVPSKYGALHHVCKCKTSLPSSILVRKGPRNSLHAICPICWQSGRETPIEGSDSRTICVPVVGGESAGKSAFITAYAANVINTIAPAVGLTTRFYNDEKKFMFSTMLSNFQQGIVNKTATTTRIDEASAFSFSFYIEGKQVKPQRLLELYDIAGETFVSNSEHEQQRQYEHCDGIVLVVDPMALPEVEAKFWHSLDASDKGTISSAHLEDVMAALNNDLRETTKHSRARGLSTPLAVVINKVDETTELSSRIGDQAVARLKALDTKKYGDSWDDMDFLCRQFLVDMDMTDVIDLIDQNFSNSRFFSVSAIGHSAGNGNAFDPKNVNAVMDWIVAQTDPTLGKALKATAFSRAKLPINKPVFGLYDQLLGVDLSAANSTSTTSRAGADNE